MKILILADPASTHTSKWVNSLSEAGIKVLLLGMSEYDKSLYNKNIDIEILNNFTGIKGKASGSYLKLLYITAYPFVKKIIKSFKPDLIHSHYASSYGLLGALVNYHPFLISVWGTDIYNFPRKSILHRNQLKFVFSRADQIFSTSKAMAIETNKYTGKDIKVIPFGIDTKVFSPTKVKRIFNDDDIVIGTIKTLEADYGIEYLIKAFFILKKEYPALPIKLLIIGKGSLEKKLKDLARDLIQCGDAIFTGYIPYTEVYLYHNMIDIEVFPSLNESFGTSVAEASACGNPVIISDVGGMPEIIEEDITGIKVKAGDELSLAKAIGSLIMNKDKRIKMGLMGRERIKKYFNWQDNVETMISCYKNILIGK